MNLSSFDASLRRAELTSLAASTQFPPENDRVNMHIHTFFSYNGEGWSPSQIAYEMKKLGLYSAAICDFDVSVKLDAAPSQILSLPDETPLPFVYENGYATFHVAKLPICNFYTVEI